MQNGGETEMKTTAGNLCSSIKVVSMETVTKKTSKKVSDVLEQKVSASKAKEGEAEVKFSKPHTTKKEGGGRGNRSLINPR